MFVVRTEFNLVASRDEDLVYKRNKNALPMSARLTRRANSALLSAPVLGDSTPAKTFGLRALSSSSPTVQTWKQGTVGLLTTETLEDTGWTTTRRTAAFQESSLWVPPPLRRRSGEQLTREYSWCTLTFTTTETATTLTLWATRTTVTGTDPQHELTEVSKTCDAVFLAFEPDASPVP